MNRKQKPASAYQYYQKLVQDFDSLEQEMEGRQEEQNELETQLERIQANARTSKAQNQQLQLVQWERERDRHLESFVEHNTALDILQAQAEALELQELRLQAEMEVLRERQQEISETEARQIYRLVHERTTLLDDELAKGKLDLDYIAGVVSSGCRNEHTQAREIHKIAMKNLVQGVQNRRQHEFEIAEANFKARMRSFQLEKDALAKKAKELRVIKQRGLQILSQNQQLAIKSFFDAPPATRHHEEATVATPTLNFEEILQSLNQSGAQVEKIQSIDTERNSGSREHTDALQEAHAILGSGSQRIEAIQKILSIRKKEAHELGITTSSSDVNSSVYDGVWGIESYDPRQYETVYFMRGLVFYCMDTAMREVNTQPAKDILEFEVKRWRDTHSCIEQDRNRENLLQFASKTLDDLMDEVMADIATDIRLEFEVSSYRVRSIITSTFKNILFPVPRESIASPPTKKVSVKSQSTVSYSASSSILRSSIFESSFGHLRSLRNRRKKSSSVDILHQNFLPVLQAPVNTHPLSTATRPAKKTFGLFGASKATETIVPRKETPTRTQSPDSGAHKLSEAEAIPCLTVGAPKSPALSAKVAVGFWKNEPQIRLRTIILPTLSGYSSCLQVSPNGDLLICGTTEGELILWDLLPDQPTIHRAWSPPKAERSRISRVVLSSDSLSVMAFFRRRSVGIFAINSSSVRASTVSKSKQARHSDDCFPIDPSKLKPRGLELLVQLSAADALAELGYSADLRERAPSVVGKDSITSWAAAELSSGSFFASASLAGLTLCNTSIICGASTGDLLKFNLQPQRESYGASLNNAQAVFDSPGFERRDTLEVKTIQREFFRCHRRAVLFASCINRKGQDPIPPELISVDQDGIVCIWKYITENFTGFGWFEPTLRLRLELSNTEHTFSSAVAAPVLTVKKGVSSKQIPSLPATGVLKGEVVQAALTPDDTRLVFMVFYMDATKKEVAGTLRFFQLMTASMVLDQVQINVDFTGGNGAPRFTLTTNFLLLLANNRVRVYTLRTGSEARHPIELVTSGQQVVFNTITCCSSRTGKSASPTKSMSRCTVDPTTITFAVSGDQHSRLLVYSFTPSNSHKPEMKIKAKRER
ncbi:unnamed protein product [Phytophthora fragariaefolia]|uniref:Unnamed protein product n=1 Tax=Phytophthora fragariaefolia TaxID=1490495 RepID=A0A9W6UDU6_9STRA|nr:unnamed protein product [Phytophthora fragariaefolia]